MPQLGNVNLTLELKDRTLTTDATPLQAAVIELFDKQGPSPSPWHIAPAAVADHSETSRYLDLRVPAAGTPCYRSRQRPERAVFLAQPRRASELAGRPVAFAGGAA